MCYILSTAVLFRRRTDKSPGLQRLPCFGVAAAKRRRSGRAPASILGSQVTDVAAQPPVHGCRTQHEQPARQRSSSRRLLIPVAGEEQAQRAKVVQAAGKSSLQAAGAVGHASTAAALLAGVYPYVVVTISHHLAPTGAPPCSPSLSTSAGPSPSASASGSRSACRTPQRVSMCSFCQGRYLVTIQCHPLANCQTRHDCCCTEDSLYVMKPLAVSQRCIHW